MGRVLRPDRTALPKVGNGRPPIGLERLLRMYCNANWFNLADESREDAIYDVAVFRDFYGFDLGEERIADAGTLLNFRHLLEAHDLGVRFEKKIQATLARVWGEAELPAISEA